MFVTRLGPSSAVLSEDVGMDIELHGDELDFKELKAEKAMPDACELRQSKYLNNLIEQDHCFIKRLEKLGMGFFSSETAWRTLQGYEAMNMLRKGQIHGIEKGNHMKQVAFIASQPVWSGCLS
jgi:hypothetical protein